MNITEMAQIKSFLGVPIFTKEGALFGTLCAFDTHRFFSFTPEHVTLLQTFSTFLTYVIDLEDSKAKVERDLDRLTTKTQLVLQSITEGVIGIDLNGKITFCNPSAAALLGYSSEEIMDTMSIGQVSVHLSQRLEETIEDTSAFLLKNGGEIPVEFVCTPIYDKEFRIGAVLTFKDITERRKNEELALKSEKLALAGQLAAGIAHEIRNPLTAIKGFLTLIDSGSYDKRYTQIMSSEINRIELILTELLMLAKPQVVNYKRTDICLLLKEVISLLETQAIIKNVSIHHEVIENLWVYCEPNQIKQVFINLIKNALDALPKGGWIQIDNLVENHTVQITVTDNGVGIPPSTLKRLGQPFYTTKEKGTGLGLMVSNNIIANHDGKLVFDSRLNEGTTVKVTLPLYKDSKPNS